MQEERSFMSLNEKNKLEKFEEKIVVKYRKYSKKTERVKKTNQMVIVCMSIIKGFLLLGFITQILLGKQGAEFIGIPAVLLGLGLYSRLGIVYKRSFVCYFKKCHIVWISACLCDT